ncbi:unnamed protein product [Chrysoparadoxa australica]
MAAEVDKQANATPLLTGNFVFPAGARYEGQYIEDETGRRSMNGHGTYTDGPESYSGEWKDNKMHGIGKYCFATGATYEGQFDGNCFHGHGVYRFNNGAWYEGGWVQNKMHGAGCYVDHEKVMWEGRWVNGKYDNGRDHVLLSSMPGAEPTGQDPSAPGIGDAALGS